MSAGPSPGRLAPEPPSRGALWIVFATVLVDFTGFFLLIPVLPIFAERLGGSDLEVGLLLAVYALAQLLVLPFWGWLSDRAGRKPVILVAIAGTAASYGLLATADSVAAIYVSRALAGAFAASVSTAQAIITDVTSPKERARGMGLVGAAIGIALTVGPILGGRLAEEGERIPYYSVGLLSLANLLLAWRRLPESRAPGARPPVRDDLRSLGRALVPAPVRLVAAVHERRIGLYLYLFFHIITAFSALEAMLALYLVRRFGVGELEAGSVFAWIGVFLAFAQGVLVGRLVLRFSELAIVSFGLAATALGLLAIGAVPSYGWLFAVGPVIAVGHGVAYPAFQSLYTKACEESRAGELIGQSQSMATTGRIVGPTLAGLAMQHVRLDGPFLLGGALMLLACAVIVHARSTLVPLHRDPRSGL